MMETLCLSYCYYSWSSLLTDVLSDVSPLASYSPELVMLFLYLNAPASYLVSIYISVDPHGPWFSTISCHLCLRSNSSPCHTWMLLDNQGQHPVLATLQLVGYQGLHCALSPVPLLPPHDPHQEAVTAVLQLPILRSDTPS